MKRAVRSSVTSIVCALAVLVPNAYGGPPPAISGSARVGDVLTAISGRPNDSRRWEVERSLTASPRRAGAAASRAIRERWRAIPGARSRVLVVDARLEGLRIRVCARPQGIKTWRCSTPTVRVAAAAPVAQPADGPAAAKPVLAGPTAPEVPPASPPTPPPVLLVYPDRTFTHGENLEALLPAVSGGSGARHFSFVGTLPSGVGFDPLTGALTGPARSMWNFRAAEVSAGRSHTCALTSAGGAKCWGFGGGGRLGNGATADQGLPVDVAGLTTGVSRVSTGGGSSCAITTLGALKCWGQGALGNLGNGQLSDQSSPVDVAGLGSAVTQVSLAAQHTCAVAGGAAKCWGLSSDGRLGDGGSSPYAASVPWDVAGLSSGVRSVHAGDAFSCAVMNSGGVKCWGLGSDGQIGNGALASQNTPQDVIGLGSGVLGLATGKSHACAVTAARGVKCWGDGASGQLGDGGTADASTPVDVQLGSEAVVQVAAGDDFTCARTTAGAVLCWGSDLYGQLGNGSADSSSKLTPVAVTGLAPGALDLSAGAVHACVAGADRASWCWGRARYGRLGDNEMGSVNRDAPVKTLQSGPQPGFPFSVQVTVTDDLGTTTFSPGAFDVD